MCTADTFRKAFETRDAEEFMRLIFPKEWSPIIARILESGVTMSEETSVWAPRWTAVSPNIRNGHTELQTHVKSCIYRAHDFIHQLWGLPIPTSWDEEGFYLYKRAQMCGEVAVLLLTEFVLVSRLLDQHPTLSDIIMKRNAIPMLRGPLASKSTREVAARLDGVLHKKKRPKWLRDHYPSSNFADDYVPMLEHDRRMVDHNWKLMVETGWAPTGLPNSRYGANLDGLELTLWMVDDFFHLLHTDQVVDKGLAEFNKSRREGIQLPNGWNNVD